MCGDDRGNGFGHANTPVSAPFRAADFRSSEASGVPLCTMASVPDRSK
jgi:hypothetical protein